MSKTSVPLVQQKKRPPHLWKKGQSGNPSGLIKFSKELRSDFQSWSPEALERLVQLMRSKKEIIALKACEVILSRGYGPPSIPLEDDLKQTGEMLADFSRLSNEEWEQFKVLNHKVLVKNDENEKVVEPSRDQKVYG